ncbi:MAG: hypothetical protein IKQ59_04340 [Prevotella sp.]|nr:hypothetical protein [Prevotella sp.]
MYRALANAKYAAHLGTFIKKASRLTIMQWLNRHTIQKAKVLLRYMARYRVFP